MLQKIEKYQHFIEEALSEYNLPSEPNNLYEPLKYFLNIGGKRMRPVLTLMAYELFDKDYSKAKNAALAIELFHNFTLIHDDIMDKAPLRRGHQTVHQKWNENIAILCGDALMIESYKALGNINPDYLGSSLNLFNNTAIEVCEGQQLDMDFEKREDVSIEEYINMIRLKTAVLLGCSLKMGAIIGGAKENAAQGLYTFGVNLGIAFQLQDDMLDIYADQNKFGKQVGGDIVAQKKTFLLIKAFELADENQKLKLHKEFNNVNNEVKINGVKALYEELGIDKITSKRINEFFSTAMESLEQIDINEELKVPLKNLATFLLGRES